jgi:hypothetical protein
LWKIHRKIRFYVVCHTLFGHIFPIKSPLSMLKSPMFTGQLPFSFSTRSSTVWSWLFVTTMVRTGEPRLEKHPIHCQFSSTSIYSIIFHYIPLYSTIFHYIPLYSINYIRYSIIIHYIPTSSSSSSSSSSSTTTNTTRMNTVSHRAGALAPVDSQPVDL